MPSENAKAVAREVIETVRKGKKVNKGEIIKKHGYAATIAIQPTKVTNTKSYQDEMRPFVEQLEEERQRLMNAIKMKMLDDVDYKDAVDSMDKLTKNIQLLNGGKTSNEGISFSWQE